MAPELSCAWLRNIFVSCQDSIISGVQMSHLCIPPYDPCGRPVRFKIRNLGPRYDVLSGIHTYRVGRPKTAVSEIGCLCIESDVADILPFVAGRHNIFWKIWSTPTIDSSHSCAISFSGRNEEGMWVPPVYLKKLSPIAARQAGCDLCALLPCPCTYIVIHVLD